MFTDHSFSTQGKSVLIKNYGTLRAVFCRDLQDSAVRIPPRVQGAPIYIYIYIYRERERERETKAYWRNAKNHNFLTGCTLSKVKIIKRLVKEYR